MARIDYYLFPISPFNYLAGTRLEEVAARHQAEIVYKPFSLPEVGKHTGFVPLGERPEARKAYRLQELTRISEATGLKINPQPAHWPTNPVPSCSAIIAAQAAGGGDLPALVHALMRACWAEERDIAEDSVVRECLEDAGFDGALADSGMLSGAETYERNTREALDAGVFGAPTYVVGDQVFWGQDRLDYLDRHLGRL